MAVVFNFVRAVTFQASCTLKLTCEGVTCEGDVTPLPTILALWDTRVHIGLSDSYNITADVEALVDKFLGSQAVLWIPDIYPDNSHVWFGRDFDDTELRGDIDIVENVKGFDKGFHDFGVDKHVCAFQDIRNAKDF